MPLGDPIWGMVATTDSAAPTWQIKTAIARIETQRKKNPVECIGGPFFLVGKVYLRRTAICAGNEMLARMG